MGKREGGGEGGDVRLELDRAWEISFCRAEMAFLRALIRTSTPAGGVRGSKATKMTVVLAV